MFKGGCDELDGNRLANTGVFAYNFPIPGIYYFEISNGESITMTTVVASSKQMDHKIAITDNEASPKILDVYPEDRVWFVWDETRRAMNIRQVDHENKVFSGGFVSGAAIESPGTFMKMFNELGVYYYRSDYKINHILGAIVVVPEPMVNK